MRNNRTSLLVRCWIVTALIVGYASLVSVQAATNDPSRSAELNARYAADLESLAKWCDANGLAAEAGKTRRLVTPTDPYKLYVPVLPDEVGPAKLPADAPEKVAEWDTRLNKLRREQAAAMFEMARRAVRSGQAGLAFHLALGGAAGRSRLRARPAFVRLSEVPQSLAHGLRGEEAPRRQRLEREVRLAAEGATSPLRGGRAIPRRPLDLGRRGRPPALRYPLRLGRGNRALHDLHQP